MKKRIGNDIQFTWHIFRKDGDTQVPEDFTGKDVEVKLISPLQRPVTIENVSIATGVVTFTFRGKHQVTLGNYVAVLLENRGENGMVTLDVVSAVTLVPHSYMEEDGDDGDVIEAESVELTSTISAGSGGGFVQQQADWAQTDDTAVDYIKNKPNLGLFAKLDVSNEHEQNTFDTYKQLYGGEQELRRTSIGGGGLLLRVGQLQPVWFEYEDAKKLKNLPTGEELAEELADKQDTIDDLAAIRSGAQAGATAVQPSDLTPIDNRLDNVEYCLGDYLKDIYVFNASNKPEVSSEPVYTDKTLYTVVNKNGSFKSLNCKLSSDSQAISALWIGRLYDNGKILFTQSGTATLYLVLYANLSSPGSMLLSVCDSNDNVVMNVHSSELTYNSSNVCTAFSCEVAEGYYIKMEYNDRNVCVWLGQIDLEINEVKQISTDVHANSNAIVAIEQKIPAQASSSNQLADKDFVNSSVATATATYRGSYNLVSDLLLSVSATQQQIAAALATKMNALSITPDNNDYCFVQIPTADATPTEIARIDRYKYDGTAWAYEYSLNNSSFTAAQWAALNSGITSGLVAKLSALPTNSELATLLSGKADKSEMSVVSGTGTDADKTTITLKQGTSATVLTAHQNISGKENVMPITTATGATLTAVVGNYYRLDNVGTLAITLPTITGATKLQAITFLLACGSSALVTFAPQGSETILYQEDFALEADTTYEVTALWNGSEWTLSRVIYE